MAHPYGKHNEHAKGHSRVHHILKSGGHGAAKHADRGSPFGRVNSKGEAAMHEHKVDGNKGPARFARGGKVKAHHTKTNINIVVPHKSAEGQQAGAPMAPPPTAPMGAPAPMTAGMPGMGAPPPMRARGGKVIGGEASAGNIKKWSARARKNSYARGGRLPDAGAATGVARLEQAGKRGK